MLDVPTTERPVTPDAPALPHARGPVSRAVLAIALEITPDSALRFVIDPLSLTRIDRLEGGWRVVAVNQRCALF